MAPTPRKFVYCVAFGGLNDVINQTMLGYDFCQKHGRLLVLNTRLSRLADDLGNYFHLTSPILSHMPLQDFFSQAKLLSVKPVENLEAPTSREIALEQNSDHDILISANHKYSATKTKRFLTLFELRANLLTTLRQRYQQLPPDYIAVHIRNTDYASDVPQFIKHNQKNFEGRNIFLASDNRNSIEQFKQINACVFTFSNIPEYNAITAGGIHKYPATNKYELNCDSIFDLILLSLGQKLYVSCFRSGFSQNALAMHKDADFQKLFRNKLETSHVV